MTPKSIIHKLLPIVLLAWGALCGTAVASDGITPGAERTEAYVGKLKGKRVAILANQTSMVGTTHLVDTLHAIGVDITAIFAAEHGFRGDKGAGEKITGGVDPRTGIKIVSLYGGSKAALDAAMRGCDLVVVDIQDVGTRFYTYYITMLRLMNRCAALSKEMMVLDRPNPTGHYVDGPILDMKHKSGVGALPIPVVHGMTLGELAMMINGERWLDQGRKCRLSVVRCTGYDHRTFYTLPVAPSPNLPDMTAIYLYPSLCYFEGTPVSLGRGTDKPFKVYGHPRMRGDYDFTPQSTTAAPAPPCLGQRCHGYDLSGLGMEELRSKRIDLTYLITAYRESGLGDKFFTPFFEKLIGVDYVREMIVAGKSAEEISKMWEGDVEKFKAMRRPYLLYAE
ncbi:MAG TPA: DUF1343 domain-containing protein [Candidatus Avibacteroides faecavium]|nr:DUF1343 domain-containing protein [Candidatus Avibacteroides faecavium]